MTTLQTLEKAFEKDGYTFRDNGYAIAINKPSEVCPVYLYESGPGGHYFAVRFAGKTFATRSTLKKTIEIIRSI